MKWVRTTVLANVSTYESDVRGVISPVTLPVGTPVTIAPTADLGRLVGLLRDICTCVDNEDPSRMLRKVVEAEKWLAEHEKGGDRG